MCGINGFVSKSFKETKIIDGILDKMNHEIIHRGPDQDGFFAESNQNFSIGMAMRRLSIIDLSTGKQPIFSADNQKVIVFNGEIYNYKLLKQEHLSEYNFKTNSDTEVIIALYEKYGVESFAMLDGMFAFSIYDKKQDKIIIARDFFGEKPLYYTKTNNRFIWASELKSLIKSLPIKPKVNTKSLNLFLQLTYIPAPYTIYEDVHKLEANHYLEFDCSSFSFEIHEIKQNFKKYGALSKSEAVKTTHDLVQESVVSRSIADVPLGTFLSGGVDSSIVSLCLAQQSSTKIETFSIGFDKKSFDETDKSRAVAQLIQSNHHVFIITEKDLTANIDEIILNFDEPFADSSALASYVVSNKTKEFVTVALTGDGGDEVFGGYNKYYMGSLNDKYTKLIPKSLHNSLSSGICSLLNTNQDNRGIRFKINRLLKSINYEGDFYYNIISLGFQENEVKEVLKQNLYNENPLAYYKNKIGDKNKTLTDFRNIDQILSLEGDMLVKVDRTSMLTSLECRAPFLNKEIWNFTSQLPENFLINDWDKKHILKESFKDYFPKDFLNKSKKGFGVPVGDWLRADLRNELLSYVDKAFVEKQNIFHFEIVSKLVNNHLQRKIDNTFRVWTFFCFQKWYKQTYEK
ncbi:MULTISPECIES: asparagine synthase (glutamine-hydrolyzing) [unclassified Flavobacterium]|jgi:asparagine synthase (glutamine-hydrolysing)|uniref:asparagine synthase (glutamine-hydrolyzing) n=1 Tax=unclassified Flavobacterium TaxID=196869 RepID=UPI0025C2A427|nr:MULTISPECIES: asparagine synthase (glutamine-hydrolyzing) [unclassified Flavobacterium]